MRESHLTSIWNWAPRLATLRQKGVLILGSGNVVHNLGLIDWRQPDAAFDWKLRFDGRTQEVMTSAPAEAAGLQSHADYRRAAPTPEHFPAPAVPGRTGSGGRRTRPNPGSGLRPWARSP